MIPVYVQSEISESVNTAFAGFNANAVKFLGAVSFCNSDTGIGHELLMQIKLLTG
jgi:hypothetical protein